MGRVNTQMAPSAARHVDPQAHEGATLLYALGTLIGNIDMHHGNLSFIIPHERACAIEPAHHLLPIGFQPGLGSALNDSLMPANMRSLVRPAMWPRTYPMETPLLNAFAQTSDFSGRFAPCMANVQTPLAKTDAKVNRFATD